jgi:hypothetical protein
MPMKEVVNRCGSDRGYRGTSFEVQPNDFSEHDDDNHADQKGDIGS